MRSAFILYGATDLGPPEFSGDLLWRTRFKAPDPFLYIEIDGTSYLFASSLEIERASKEANVDEVISIEHYCEMNGIKTTRAALIHFLKAHNVGQVLVPDSFHYALGKVLEEQFEIKIKQAPFFPKRAVKSSWEIQEIEKSQRAVEYAVQKAVDFLADCSIHGENIVYKKEVITSEMVRSFIDQNMYGQGFLGVDTIVASGVQAADPHGVGSGPLQANSAIVMDVFPLSLVTHYYADQTRTFFKGAPSPDLQNMYRAVLEAQERAIANVRAGADGYDITQEVMKVFAGKEFPTEKNKRPAEGFIHGVGHGVGIDIHEYPRIGLVPEILEEGNVVTVEPGLYYHQARNHIPQGGIRIEDMLVVEKNGAKNLTNFPKDLKSMIIP